MGLFRRLFGASRTVAVAPVRLGSLEIGDAWARCSSGGASGAAGFFTLANGGSTADRLTAAASPVAARIEIHAIKVVGSGIAMRPLPNGLNVPSGVTLTLKPRGYHLRLLDLRHALGKGTRVPVTLTFEKAGNIEIALVVGDDGPIGDEALMETAQPG